MAPAQAQETCQPEKLAAAIDTYAAAPFSARSWRMLKGLADPGVAPSYRFEDDWARREEWSKLVASLAPAATALQQPGYSCRISYPLQVLKDRAGKLGKEHPYIKQWLRVQEQVVQACTETGTGIIPLPDRIEVAEDLANTQAEDRAYQEAQVAFYRDPAKALELFGAIAKSESVHRAAAHYNVANLLANAKKFAEARGEARAILADASLASVHGITRELLGYIANLEDTADSWTSLIDDTIATIEKPLAETVKDEQSRRDYANALYDIDYAGIRGKRDDWWLDGTLPENPTLSKALADAARRQPMALWMMAGQQADDAYRSLPWSMVGETWNNREAAIIGKALALKPAADGIPPLALALLDATRTVADGQAPDEAWKAARSAIAKANASCGADAETAAAGYLLAHAVRLSAMAGKTDMAIAELAKVPFKSAVAYSDQTVARLLQYLLGQGRLAEARAVRDALLTDELFKGLPEASRVTTTERLADLMGWIAEDEAQWKKALGLRANKVSDPLLNFLPSKTLWSFAEDPMFSPAEKALLARAAWTRSFARDRKIAAAQTEKLYALNPALKAVADRVAADYPGLSASQSRLLTMLRSPRFGILVSAPDLWEGIEVDRADFNAIDNYDPNDKNWWCPFEKDRQLSGLRSTFNDALGLDLYDRYGDRSVESFYDPNQRATVDGAREAVLKQHPVVDMIDWRDVRALASVASGPRKLSQEAIRWAKSAKSGTPAAAEALALAVRTTRYGCRWHGGHGSYSRAAQQLLQRKFKETSWAAQTTYWFDCMYQADGADPKSRCEPKTWSKQSEPR